MSIVTGGGGAGAAGGGGAGSAVDLHSLSKKELQDIAVSEGIKKVGKGWEKCCPPAGSKANIITAIESAGKGVGQTNINNIAKGNSARLASALTDVMADAILHEKTTVGEFADFKDLAGRVRDIGPQKVRDLIESGFIIQPTKRGMDRQAAVGEVLEALPDVRGDVTSLAPQVWRHRDRLDLYTQLSKAGVEASPGGAEVDHVWECQLLNYANTLATEGLGVAARTKGAQDALQKLVNSKCNLNVTTHDANQAKWKPVKAWIKARKKGESVDLMDVARNSDIKGVTAMVDSGDWARVEKSMVSTWDELDAEKGDHRLTQCVMEQLQEFMAQMHLEG
jgi:hypothetical protein